MSDTKIIDHWAIRVPELEGEIERLRAALQWERDNETVLFKEKSALRAAVIEECARVAEFFPRSEPALYGCKMDIAAAILALKDRQ